MIIFEIYLDGVIHHATGNINTHQKWLDKLHEAGRNPVEKRVKS